MEETMAAKNVEPAAPKSESDSSGGVLPSKRGRDSRPAPRFSSDEEFEAFWRRLEDEARSERLAPASNAGRMRGSGRRFATTWSSPAPR